MLGTAIAAGASLLSGLLGRSSAKKQAKKEEAAIKAANDKAQEMAAQMNKEARARADAAALVPVMTEKAHAESQLSRSSTSGGVDMAGFMAAAEDNGFNPLTFLRSGALSLFAKSDTVTETILEMEDWACTTGERAMDAAIQGQYIPQLSPVIASTKVPGMGEVFGNALTAGANQYLGELSQQQNNDFQMSMLDKQLAAAQQRGAYNGPRSGYVPQAFLTGSPTKTNTSKSPLNMYVPWIDNSVGGGGRTVWLPHQDMPDSEQLATAIAGSAAGPWQNTTINLPDFSGVSLPSWSSPASVRGRVPDAGIPEWFVPTFGGPLR